MSSFIVEQKTINRFLTWLYWLPSNEISRSSIYKVLGKYKLDDKNTDENFKKLGQDMIQMNYDAVNYRYSENKKADEFKLEDEKVCIEQVLKSLQCFLYQCYEGTIDRKKLFRDLKKVEEIIKNMIIDKIPAYEKAEWR